MKRCSSATGQRRTPGWQSTALPPPPCPALPCAGQRRGLGAQGPAVQVLCGWVGGRQCTRQQFARMRGAALAPGLLACALTLPSACRHAAAPGHACTAAQRQFICPGHIVLHHTCLPSVLCRGGLRRVCVRERARGAGLAEPRAAAPRRRWAGRRARKPAALVTSVLMRWGCAVSRRRQRPSKPGALRLALPLLSSLP